MTLTKLGKQGADNAMQSNLVNALHCLFGELFQNSLMYPLFNQAGAERRGQALTELTTPC